METISTQRVEISEAENGRISIYSTIRRRLRETERKLVGDYNSRESAAKGKLLRKRAMSVVRKGILAAQTACYLAAIPVVGMEFLNDISFSDALRVLAPFCVASFALHIPKTAAGQESIKVDQQHAAIQEFAVSGEKSFARTYPLTRSWRNL
jgi:hypothetical protein